MSDGIVIALIAAAQAVTLALLGILSTRLGKVRADSAAAREQLENNHSTNMREENDSRHAESRSWWAEVRRDIGGIREEIRGLRGDLRHERSRIDDIEDTLTTRKA